MEIKHYSFIEIIREIKKYSELNEKWNIPKMDVVKAAFRGKFIPVNNCIKSTT